jgi:hypothetical protein
MPEPIRTSTQAFRAAARPETQKAYQRALAQKIQARQPAVPTPPQKQEQAVPQGTKVSQAQQARQDNQASPARNQGIPKPKPVVDMYG